MRALTISQPWAWLIARGHKPIENRRWTTGYRGPLLVHAGRGEQYRDGLHRIRRAMAGRGIEVPAWEGLVKGAVVALAGLVDVVPLGEGKCLAPDWAEGPWCWLLRDVRPLDSPAKGPGAQGLWTPTDELVGRVQAELAAKEVFKELSGRGYSAEQLDQVFNTRS